MPVGESRPQNLDRRRRALEGSRTVRDNTPDLQSISSVFERFLCAARDIGYVALSYADEVQTLK